MRFARFVFIAAGIWGIAVLVPLYFLIDVTGRQYEPPSSYPQFFYGFIGVALAWQLVFLLVGSDPVRYRLLMIPAVVEKCGFAIPTALLYGRGRIPATEASAAIPDVILGTLFILAFLRTRRR